MRTYTLKHIAKVLLQLKSIGIDGVIIGDTCIDIMLGRPSEGDIDLFVTSTSPLFEEVKIREIAHQKGWSTGTTDLGTPSITMNIDDVDITVELYENIMDFYIPIEALDICKRSITIDNIDVHYIAVECWMVFKARRGSGKDIAELIMLKQMIDEGMITINKSTIERVLNFYEEDIRYIIDRLRNIKLL